eukprot:TRINITY_DN11977_c1_g1_i1.p2 TRINITY_DN11977_c1_g1~~TRINITY_DN11977_c1_g1_i1.p2  ORF type:complete len:202 (-),score=21.46 TRINITY_DN11977_c1_g1_i1:164-769(-)
MELVQTACAETALVSALQAGLARGVPFRVLRRTGLYALATEFAAMVRMEQAPALATRTPFLDFGKDRAAPLAFPATAGMAVRWNALEETRHHVPTMGTAAFRRQLAHATVVGPALPAPLNVLGVPASLAVATAPASQTARASARLRLHLESGMELYATCVLLVIPAPIVHCHAQRTSTRLFAQTKGPAETVCVSATTATAE